MLETQLSTNRRRSKAELVFARIVAKSLSNASPLFQSFVDSLVPRLRSILRFPVSPRHIVGLHANFVRQTEVTIVGLHHLTWRQLMDEARLENLPIRPASARKPAVDPDNIARLNAHSNLISQTSTFKLE